MENDGKYRIRCKRQSQHENENNKGKQNLNNLVSGGIFTFRYFITLEIYILASE